MKKIISMLCAAGILVTSLSISAQDTENSYTQTVDSARLAVAEKLLEGITDTVPFENEVVTRAEFTDAVADVMLVANSVSAENIYSDVSTDNPYAKGITAAAKLNWISITDKFNPDNEIAINEAIKIVVSAVNYGERAQYSGGYPTGYLKEANRLGLFEGIVDAGDVLKPEQAKIIIYNMLTISNLEFGFKQDKEGINTIYIPTDETILEAFYNIIEVEGIVNETPYNSFSYGSIIAENSKYIYIDGMRYTYENASPGLLGKRVHAFIEKDERRVVSMETDVKNNVFTRSLYDLEMNNGKITYISQNDRLKELKWNGGIAVYNGRTLKSLEEGYFEEDGYAEFIDNNNDNLYDVVHITAYTYLNVGSIDRFNRRIGDVDSEDNSLDFSACAEGMVKFYDENGEEISVYGIENGMILRAVVPEDMVFGAVYVLKSSINGMVSSIGEDFIKIDGEEYKTTKHFNKYIKNDIVVGTKYDFYTDDYGYIINIKTEYDKYLYGFIMGATTTGVFDCSILLKVFNENNEFVVLEVSDRAYVDGVEIENAQDTFSSISATIADDAKRMIKYKTNKDGKVSSIDFPEEYDYTNYEMLTADENNNMIYYPDYAVELLYRNGSKIFNGDVAVGNASCFMIPKDLDDDEEYFKVGESGSVMSHDKLYTPHIYDIDEYGSAGAVVVRGRDETLSTADGSYLVESVYNGFDPKGTAMQIVDCWNNGKIHNLYLPKDISVNKDSGSTLVPGDIIRVKLDSYNRIFNLVIDFDYDNFAINGTLPESNYMGKRNQISYWTGIPYSLDKDNSLVQLATKENKYGEPDFSKYSLSTLSVKTTNILRFDCELENIRPVTFDEIKSYREFDEGCDYIVMRSNFDSPNMVVIYDGYPK